MELTQNKTKTVIELAATQDDITINASVTLSEGKIKYIEASAKLSEDGEAVRFNCYRNGEKIKISISNFDTANVAVCTAISEFVNLVQDKYEAVD